MICYIERCLLVFLLLFNAHPLGLGLSLTNWIWLKWFCVRSQSKILKGLVASTFILSRALSLCVRSLAPAKSPMERPHAEKPHREGEALRLCRKELRKWADYGNQGSSMWPQLSGPASTRWLSHTSTGTGRVSEKKYLPTELWTNKMIVVLSLLYLRYIAT